MEKFRNLFADEIEVRIGQVYKDKCSLLLYKNARADMDLLDNVVGADKWQRKHYEVKDNMYCSVGIKCGDDWIWKDDCGTESNTEKEKGEASDSFKRACVNWGIGRELYTAPKMHVNCQTDGKKVLDLTNFKVSSISYHDKTIKAVYITAYNKDTRKSVSFSFRNDIQIPIEKDFTDDLKPTTDKPAFEKPKPIKECYVCDDMANDIYKRAADKGFSEKQVDEVVSGRFNVDSIFKLTTEQGNQLIKRIEAKQ